MDESKIDAIFSELMGGVEIPDDISDSNFEALVNDGDTLDDVIEKILFSLTEHLVAIDAMDVSDDDYRSAIAAVTRALYRDFLSIEGLNSKDIIAAYGDTIFMLVDEEDNSMAALPIPEGCQIVGKFNYIVVTDIPTFESLPAIRKDSTQFIDEINPLPMMRFGAAFMLEGAQAVDANGNIEPLSEELSVLIPINYPQVQLKRIV